MDFIHEKIRVITEKLLELEILESKIIEYEYVEYPQYKTSNTPPDKTAGWKIAPQYMQYSGIDNHYWLHFELYVPMCKNTEEYRIAVKTGREGQWDAKNPQFTVFLNGKTTQALDTNHTWIPLECGKKYDVYMYLYTGMVGGNFSAEISLEKVDLKIESLFYDLRVPFKCLKHLDETGLNYANIRNCLDKAVQLLDLRDFYSEKFYASIDAASEYMKTEFYGNICGKNTDGNVACIGHTHIDVAWLWTVAQTREKAQRSFSTVLNLMKRYEDYKFMSSQPQLYQYIKEQDPEMYAEIKQRIKEGRWEAEGAMWLEADTNLISGESLVRQILYGKRFMKNEFGVDNKILWLPDVFGYSAALPQILKKCGVPQFFTTKLNWNESNKMPNDSFIWQGIDGSEVFSCFAESYVNPLDPNHVKIRWDSYKNKAHNDTAILPYGFGDGGGGPTAQMIEKYNRLKYGIPGMPNVKTMSAGEYIDKTYENFEKSAKELKSRPKWVGEMYLEMHRGTYTSIAKNKKNNRKSELLYQKAETAAVTDMLLLGGEYPQKIFEKNQTNILLNQFHDIIPGSSIKEVYDDTDAEYARILADGRCIADGALNSIKSNLKTDGGVFVYNPTPFEISDYIDVDGKLIFAENIPAHGWKVVENKPAENLIHVSEKSIENDVIKIEFDEKYHIISVFDKEENREIISENAEANRIEIFEDYPREYDAWEITDYYKQKMWVVNDVSDIKLLKNGIRITRKYQKSLIVQDIVLKPGLKRIDFITEVDWNEDHVLMKAAFPVDIRNTEATYDIQFGNITRPTHASNPWDAAKFEVCAHKWADLSEGNYGVSLLNDCKYGYSIEENVMKISLLKSATYPNPEADREHHSFTYSLYPHTGDYRTGKTVLQGYLLNMPLEASEIGKTNGTLCESFSVISSSCENAVVETVKKAEDSGDVVARVYETYNQKCNTEIKTGFDFKEVYLCDLLENNIEKLQCDNRTVTLSLKNFEIATLKFIS